MAQLVSPEAAGKLFIVVTLGSLAAAVALLHRAATGRWTLWPLFAFLSLFSRALLWGFLNYLFGVALAILGLALWILLAERAALSRCLLTAVMALVCFFAHLMAAVLLGALIVGFELGRWWRHGDRRIVPLLGRLSGMAFAFAAPVALLLTGGSPGVGAIHFSRIVRKLDLLFSVFDNYWRSFDIASFVVVVAALLWALLARRVRLAPALIGPLLVAILLFLIAPAQIMTASAVDHRLPVVIALLLPAALQGARLSPRAAQGVALVGLLLFLGRVAIVAETWASADRIYQRDLAILDQVGHGARVAVAFPSSAIASAAVPTAHLPVLAIARRDAFVPTLFAFPGQQPIALTPLGRALADAAEPSRVWDLLMQGGDAAALRTALDHYDYLVVLDRRPLQVPPQPLLHPVAAEADFALFKLQP